MPETRTEPVRLADGRALRMTIAEPPGVVRGGLVVLHESRGITEMVRVLADGLAAEGWMVVAPHIYHGEDGSTEVAEELAAGRVSGLSGESVLADTDIAFGWLAQHGISADRIGVVGFELGGTVAMVVAASRRIGAAVSVAAGGILRPLSAGLPALIDVADQLRCPWLGLYGDKFADEVAQLREAASRSETATDVVMFPAADHRFDIHPDGALEGWQRMLNWLDAHLR
ncbi:dienelactone hydrolase family protein [Actinophytocola xanthii]|uniref:Carboxymethylenebutenolidase n=1 Tax=Actinophytocola xanthii TaxID=1912961 RepID=A0A1Q8CRW0_9PSEU|nr:dienelactone hydrolase family protein [Actinophytocola xanthii]OLF17099.1 carboxymethylenebutenolidase [Actinophytocola xanthii]